MHTIRIYNSIEQDLFHAWKCLWENNSNSFFNSPYWVHAVLKAFPTDKLYIYTCYDNDILKGVIALQDGLHYHRRTLKFVGEKYYEQGCILIENDYILKILIKEIIKNNRIVFFDELRINLDSMYFLKDVSAVCPVIPLAQWPEIMKSKKKYRLRKNKFEKNQDVLSIKEYLTPETVKVLPIIAELEKNSKKIEEKKSLFNDPRICVLFNEIAKSGDFLRIAILEHNQTPISAILYFFIQNQNRIIIDYYTTYNKSYSEWNPGNILLQQTIEKSCLNNVETYDLSRGITTQKLEYTYAGIQQFNYLFCNRLIDKLYFKTISIAEHFIRTIKISVKNLIKKETIELKDGVFYSK